MINKYIQEIQRRNDSSLDELANPDGTISFKWEKLAKYYDSHGANKLSESQEKVSRQLRENGVTYNLYGDPDGLNRPWNLDPIPMVFDTKEWDMLEKGLKQRAHLLNLILKDIYGNRKLIRSGLIPFELIYHHRGFLREADKLFVDDDLALIQYATDLGRGSNGNYWVLNDLVDAPSGSGYTLENRAAMTRVFPELIRENEVRKIASYYQQLRQTIGNLSSSRTENPRIVLLTPGPTNETYFEHAYLSSFMGFTLAVGEDLTVSDGFVWLKTIKGLEKVDIIMRRVDDVYCDPLTFRGDSQLGIVGLMEAVRRKNVQIINPLGVRVLENPGLLAFLPRICQSLLGEELQISSVATWWCGQEQEKKYVIDNLDQLIVRGIYSTTKAVYGGSLSTAEKEALIARIKIDPYLFVAQETVDFSTVPCWNGKELEARHSTFRGFLVADTESKDFFMMPGGLSRSSLSNGEYINTSQAGGISKDAWVLGRAIEHPKVITSQTHSRKQLRQAHIIPSRAGERLYWLGRYMERSAYTIRIMRMALSAFNEADDDAHVNQDIVLSTLFTSLTKLTGTTPGFLDKKVLKDPEQELLSLTTQTSRMGSLAHSIQSFLSNGYAMRDRFSLDTWRILESISTELNQIRKPGTSLTEVFDALDNMVILMMAFYGLNIDNMTRQSSWHLLNMGRFVESAVNLCIMLRSLLSHKHDPESDKELLEITLRSNESLVTYRYQYRSNLELTSVLQLLLTNESNPRSLAYQILKINDHYNQLMSKEQMDYSELTPIAKKLFAALTQVRLCDLDQLCATNKVGSKYPNLALFLTNVEQSLQEISTLIGDEFFNQTSSKFARIQTARLPEI